MFSELELAIQSTTLAMNLFTAQTAQDLAPLALISCPNYFSVPNNKYYNQKQLGEESLLFIV